MPGEIDVETIQVDELPTIWCPVQNELSEQEHARELEVQATASLLWAATVPEQVLRVLLAETAIDRALKPPEGYDPEIQGEWDPDQIVFAFRRHIQLVRQNRDSQRLVLEYKLEGAGYWAIEITPDSVRIDRA
jgi:hypothetical protein